MAKSKLKEFFKNTSYSFIANVTSIILGIISILIFPKFIGVEDFGYYQLYIFYGSYVLLTALGLQDGNNLKIGGARLEELDRETQSSQFWLLGGIQTILYMLLLICAFLFVQDTDKRVVLVLTCVCAIIINPRYYLQQLLQATNYINKYSMVVITERFFSIFISLVAILFGYRSYVLLIILDITGRFLSLCLGAWFCRKIVFTRPHISTKLIREVKENVSIGSMVLFATLSSTIIIGIIRYGIENYWDIITFSKVSLTISISYMILRAINSVAVVMFPTLRRIDAQRLPELYSMLNIGLMAIIFFFLIFYYPAAKLLILWLPKYSDSVRYAAILLPMSIYECKNSMIISTYLKTIRKERILLFVNLVSISLSLLFIPVTIYWLGSIELAVVSILVVLVLRCIISEYWLSREIRMPVFSNIIFEFALSLIFIISNWYFGWMGTIIYMLSYLVYIILKKKELYKLFMFINTRVKEQRVQH